MKQNSFLKRTLIPVLLAVLMVTAIQLIPRQFPAAALPASTDGYACQVSLLENGAPTRAVTLTPEEAAALYAQLRAAQVQNRGSAGEFIQRAPLLYRLAFVPSGEGAEYELFLAPEGRLVTEGRLYKLQGVKTQELPAELERLLAADRQPTLP